MNRKIWQIVLVLALVLLLGSVTVIAAPDLGRRGDGEFQNPRSSSPASDVIAARAAYTYTTVHAALRSGRGWVTGLIAMVFLLGPGEFANDQNAADYAQELEARIQ